MGPKKETPVVIPKEKAVFYMDANGTWHNQHGKFEHPGIIRYFNASIRKDENGYFLYQSNLEREEKVYFPFKETAIFAVDLLLEDPLVIVLNTGDTIPLYSEKLVIKNDHLYMQSPDHLVKFTARAMMKLTEYLEEKDNELVFTYKNKTTPIPQK